MRILLIEDEKGVAHFIQKGLEEERHTVDVSGNGQGGLALAGTSQYDLIILDVMLPDINGFEVCRQLRNNGITAPVMMLTARDSLKDKVTGLDSGADDYLTKPFMFEEFLARVRALTRRKSNDFIVLSHKDLRLDVQAHRAYLGEQEILLRRKEFAILELLLRNKGRVLSRTQILENIWGYNFDPTTNIVDVHIKSIRERLSGISNIDYIRTVRGIGYSMADE